MTKWVWTSNGSVTGHAAHLHSTWIQWWVAAQIKYYEFSCQFQAIFNTSWCSLKGHSCIFKPGPCLFWWINDSHLPRVFGSVLYITSAQYESSNILPSSAQIWSLVNPKKKKKNPKNKMTTMPNKTVRHDGFAHYLSYSLCSWISRSLSGFTAHVSKHRPRSNSKSWRFHFSRYKSLIRRWTIVMSSLSVAPKTISNMYPVAAMWVTEGWTQHQTLEYLCSYDHQNQLLVKSRKCSLLFVLSMLK